MSKDTISFDNFAEWHGEVRGIELESQLALPDYAPTSDITVDLGRIATVARVGRLSSVHFNTYDASVTHQIVLGGVGADGSATAAGAGAATVARSKAELKHEHDSLEKFPRSAAYVRINTSHPDMHGQRLRTPEPWANLLNKGMQDGLAKACRVQLTEPKLERRTEFAVDKLIDVIGFTVLTAVTPNLSVSDTPALLALYWPVAMSMDAMGLYKFVTNKMYRRQRYSFSEKSFLAGIPYDRLALAKVLGSRTLVKATA